MNKHFEITKKCYLDCEFCYNKEDRRKWQEEMSLEFILNNVNENDVIFIGGGEPFLYSKLEELIKCLLDKNTTVIVSTNATVYRNFSELGKNERLQLQISLPAITQEKYKEICKKDLLNRVLSNIPKFIKNLGNRVFINMPVYEKNYDEINKVADYCREKNIILRIRPIIEANGFKISKELKKEIDNKILELILNGYNIVGVREDKNCKIKYYFPKL